MKTIVESIRQAFNLTRIPREQELVCFDGYDELDKKHILQTFLGKSCEDIRKKILSNQMGNMSDIEDLSLMEPYGLQYYLQPYLIHLMTDEDEDLGENDFAGFLLFAIREVIRIRGDEAFTDEQWSVIKLLVEELFKRLNLRIISSSPWGSRIIEHLQYIQKNIPR